MSSRLVLRCEDLGHGFGLYILLDISQLSQDEMKYIVAVTRFRRVITARGPFNWEWACEFYEAYRLNLMSHRDWRAVLARLMGRNPEPPTQWEGSITQYASMLYPVGSWPWLQVLMDWRKAGKEKAA